MTSEGSLCFAGDVPRSPARRSFVGSVVDTRERIIQADWVGSPHAGRRQGRGEFVLAMSSLVGHLLEQLASGGGCQDISARRSGVESPAGGDDLGSFLVVGDGEGAYGGAVPEGLGLASLVVDGVG